MPTIRRAPRAAAAVALLLVGAACGHDATGPGRFSPGIHAIAGANASDTVLTQFEQALVVEVRDSTGRQVEGMVVRFESARPTDPARQFEAAVIVCGLAAAPCGDPMYGSMQVVVDTTNADGRASTIVKLGTVAGPTKVYVTVPELGMRDSASFTVKPGSAANMVFSVPDTMVRVGGSYTIRAAVSDRFGNPRTDPVTFTGGGYASVDASGTVKGLTIGRGTVTATSGQFHASARVSVVPSGHIAAYSSSYGTTAIVEMDLDGANFRVRRATSGSTEAFPTWSPNGSGVTFTESTNTGYGNLQLLTANAQGDVVAAIADPNVALSEEGQFSRNGVWLYFYGNGSTSGYYGLWRVRADGSAPAEYIDPGVVGSQPSPSPDGTRVAFNNGGYISVLTVATGEVLRLGVGGSFPRWAPSGELVAYTSNAGELCVIGANGASPRVLGTDYNYGVDWSPDGQWLVGVQAGQPTLVRVSSGETLPLHVTAPLSSPIWKP